MSCQSCCKRSLSLLCCQLHTHCRCTLFSVHTGTNQQLWKRISYSALQQTEQIVTDPLCSGLFQHSLYLLLQLSNQLLTQTVWYIICKPCSSLSILTVEISSCVNSFSQSVQQQSVTVPTAVYSILLDISLRVATVWSPSNSQTLSGSSSCVYKTHSFTFTNTNFKCHI